MFRFFKRNREALKRYLLIFFLITTSFILRLVSCPNRNAIGRYPKRLSTRT